MNTLHLHIAGPVATVSLNRPEVRNAFNAEMIQELAETFRALADRPDIRVIVLQGLGKSFSAGADVQWMRAALDYSTEENVADALRMSDMFATIAITPQPVIARVHGAALGGGMGLMAVCDVVVAADDAVLGFTETKLGILPAVISRHVVPKIGTSWARALFTTGQRFDASLGRTIGLVHWTVPADRLDLQVAEIVRESLSAAPYAARAAKDLADRVAAMDDAEARDFTAQRIAELRTGPEGQEGLRAFLEKRKPSWLEDPLA